MTHIPKAMSYSRFNTFKTCPKSYYFKYIEGLEDPGGIAATKGSYVHEVFEDLYALRPENRTRVEAKKICATLWSKFGEEAEEGHNRFESRRIEGKPRAKPKPWDQKKFKWEVWQAVTDIWKVEEPENVKVEGLETDRSTEIAGVPIRVIVDRVERGRVVDYKTGSPWKTHKDQLSLYSAVLNDLGIERFNEASVIYVGKKQIKNTFDVTDRMRSKVVGQVCDAYEQITSLDDKDPGVWEARENNLCDLYCPFKHVCPLFPGAAADRVIAKFPGSYKKT